MAKEVTFSKQGDKYISDSISLDSSDIVLHVELKDKGDIVLERSITGDNWVVAAYPVRNRHALGEWGNRQSWTDGKTRDNNGTI